MRIRMDHTGIVDNFGIRDVHIYGIEGNRRYNFRLPDSVDVEELIRSLCEHAVRADEPRDDSCMFCGLLLCVSEHGVYSDHQWDENHRRCGRCHLKG